jgi:hypothetical protein
MKRFLAAVCFPVLAACAGSGKTEEQKQIDELTENIDDFAAALRKGKTELQTTLAEHEAIVHNKDGDLIGHYKKFNTGVSDVEKRRADVRKRVDAIKATATAYFARWEANLAKFDSEDMRKRSRERMDQTKQRYEQVHAEGTKAKELYDPLMKTLKDHVLFWGADLNQESAKELEKDSEKLKADSDALIAAVDKVIEACGNYKKAVAMHTEPPPTQG